jgi:uncharacterized protein YqeY
MDLKERIDADIKTAMLARDKDRLNALRAIKSAILLELTKEGGQAQVSEEVGAKLLQKLHKQRVEAAAIFHQQEGPIWRRRTRHRPSDRGLSARAYERRRRGSGGESIIASTGASGMKDMGRVMGEANKQLAGKAMVVRSRRW